MPKKSAETTPESRVTSTANVVSLDVWRPIATAPKDGTWIQLWREPETEIGDLMPLVFGRWDAELKIWVWPDATYDPFTQRGRLRAEKEISDGYCYQANDFSCWKPLAPGPIRSAKR